MDNEESLIRILERLEQNQREMNKDTLAKFEKIAKTFQSMSENERKERIKQASEQRRLRDTLRPSRDNDADNQNLKRSIKEETTSRSEANETLKKTTRGLAASGGALIGVLSLTTENLVDFIGKLKAVPVVGLLAASGAVGTLIRAIQDTTDGFKTLTKSGVGVPALLEVNASAVKFGLSLQEYSALISENALAVQDHGMSVVSEWITQMQDAESGLRNLGYSTREVADYMVEYLSINKKLGKGSLATAAAQNQEAQNAEKFARMLQEMAFQTGRNTEELMKAFATNAETDDNLLMSVFLDPDAHKQIMALETTIGGFIPNFQNVISGLAIGGPDLKHVGFLSQISPELVEGLNDIVQGGPTTQSDIMKIIQGINISEEMAQGALFGSRTQGDFGEMSRMVTGLLRAQRNTNVVDPEQIGETNRVANEINVLSETIYDVYNNVMGPIIEQLAEMDPSQLKAWRDQVSGLSKTLGEFVGDIISNPQSAINQIQGAFFEVKEKVIEFGHSLAAAAAGLATLTTLIGGISLLGKLGFSLTGAATGAAAGAGGALGAAFANLAKSPVGRVFGYLGGGFQIAEGVQDVGKSVYHAATGNPEQATEEIGDVIATVIGTGIGAFFGGPPGALLGAWIGGTIGDWFGGAIGGFALGTVDVVMNAGEAIGGAWNWTVDAISNIGNAPAAIGQWWDDTKTGMTEGMRELDKNLTEWVDDVGQNWNNTMNDWGSAISTWGQSISYNWNHTMSSWSQNITDWGSSVGKSWNEGVDDWKTGIGNGWNSFTSTMRSGWSNVGTFTSGLWENVTTDMSEKWDGVSTTISTGWTNVETIAKPVIDGIGVNIKSISKDVRRNLGVMWGGFTSSLISGWKTTTTNIGEFIKQIEEVARPIFETVTGLVTSVLTQLQTFFTNVGSFIANPLGGWGQADPARQEEMRNERITELNRRIAETEAEINRIKTSPEWHDQWFGSLGRNENQLIELKRELSGILEQSTPQTPITTNPIIPPIRDIIQEQSETSTPKAHNEINQSQISPQDFEALFERLNMSMTDGNQRVVDVLVQQVAELRDIAEASNAIRKNSSKTKLI